ncbi:MAG: mRNA surveillance protein pelota [Candidatus Bathyarchaeia archaeon]
MKILEEDLKRGIVKLRVETLRDLWTLYNVVEEGDSIQSRTTREIKANGVGRPSSRRVAITIWLKVKKVYFDRELNRLRVLGTIEEGPEEYSLKGQHHTLNVEPSSRLKIKKQVWYRYQIDGLKRAVEAEKPFLVISMDSDETCLAVLRDFKVEVKSQIYSNIPGKAMVEEREEAVKKYFTEVAKSAKGIVDRSNVQVIVIGPGFAKESFMRYLKERNLKLAERVIAVKSTSLGGVAGVYESLRSGVLQQVSNRIMLSEESALVEKVLLKLGRGDEDASYGLMEVYEDASAGAIDVLLVSLELLKKSCGEERSRVEDMIRTVEEKRGKVFIINPEHEAGVKLKSLGGVAAILRYPKRFRTYPCS